MYVSQLLRAGRLGSAVREASLAPHATAGELACAFLMAFPAGVRRQLHGLQRDRRPVWLSPDFTRLHARAASAFTRRGHGLRAALMEQMSVHLPALLRFEDRNSMAFSIEARVPFLDHRLVAFTFALDDRHRISQGRTKVVLREAMRGLVPDQILARRDKIGFATPEGSWFRAVWPDLRGALSASAFQNLAWLDHRKVDRLADNYERGEGDQPDSRTLWAWVNLALWLERFFRG